MKHSFVFLFSLLFAMIASARLEMNGLFTDHAVLQRGMPVPVWGKATAGKTVTVAFAGQSKEAEADDKGNWLVRLGPMKANSQGRTLTVKGDGKTVAVADVVVGEVWVGSGQSNMALTMSEAEDGKEALPGASHSLIRVFKRPKGKRERDSWHTCSPEILVDFSAVAYFFGANMHENLNVPIGLVVRSVGGTTIQRWTPAQGARANRYIAAKMQEAADRKDEFAKFEAEKGKYSKLNKPDAKTANWLGEMSNLTFYQGAGYGGLYKRMIEPLQPYAIRGVIWYQGEFNNRAGQAFDYREWQATLVYSWRKAWGQGDFPFLFVQMQVLGNATTCLLRESQATTLQRCVNSAMAVICDRSIGLHPPLKKTAGDRLAIAARNLVDGRTDVLDGPRFRKAEVEGKRILLTFDHVGTGLKAKGPALKGFYIAGEDKTFQPAQAEVKGANQTVVWSDNVPEPIAVRYAWMNDPRENMTLYDSAGLPASPFRTDDWSNNAGLGDRPSAQGQKKKGVRPRNKAGAKKRQ